MANQQKVFDQFHSTGLATAKEFRSLEADLKNIAATYEWNYKKLIPEDKNLKILDIGCGLGEFLYWLKNNGYKNFRGVDVSQEMLDLCKKNVTDKVEKINTIKEYLLDKNAGYDLIVLNDVIEHLPKNEIIDDLEIIKAALKKNGQVIIKTNNLAAITGARMRYSDFTHEIGLTEYSLRQILQVAGFKQIEVKPFAMPLVSLTRYLRYGLQKICHACWKLKFWVNFTPVPKIVDEMIFAVGIK